MLKVYGRNGGFWRRKFNFLNDPLASSSIFINAWFNNVTESNYSYDLGGISRRASRAAVKFLIVYYIAAFKLNAYISAVYFKVCEFPTLLTYISGAYEPTPSYGCYFTPF